MRQNIANEIKSAGMFFIQIDTTQDVKVEDQCLIIIRYLTDSVKEKLIAVTNVFDKTATPENLRHELFDFKENWPSIKYTVPESYDKNVDDYSGESSNESDSESINNQFILQGTDREKCTNSKQFCKQSVVI